VVLAHYDIEELTRLSTAAGLPEPPAADAIAPDVAELLNTRIREAASAGTADTIGTLGCLYHVLMNDRPSSERARVCYEKAKQTDARSYVWPHLLGRLFLMRGSYVRARIEFNESVVLNPDYADNFGWLGDLEMKDNAPEEARKNYEKFAEKAPNEVYPYVGLGDAELALGNLDAAKAHLDKAISLDPKNKRAHMILADYYDKSGDTASAARHRGFAERLFPAALSKSDPINLQLTRAAGPTTLALNQVRALAAADDLERADELRDQLLKEYPDNVLLLTGFAELSLMLGRIDDATGYLRKALAIQPDYARALVTLSDCLVAQGKFDEAIAQADKAIAVAPEMPAAYVAKGRALQRAERGEEAIEAFRTAVKFQPNNIALRTTTGELLYFQGKINEARDWCGQLVREAELSGKLTPAYAPAYQILAGIAKREGDGQGVVRNLSRALAADGTLVNTFRELAQVLIDLNAGEQALKMCQQLRETNPQMLEYAVIEGELLSRIGRKAEAIAYFEQLSKEAPNHPAPRFALALAYRESNRIDDARAQLEQIISRQPTYEAAYMVLIDIVRTGDGSAAAIDIARSALENLPDSLLAKNTLAWMLATCPDAARRDPARAIELAENVASTTENKIPNYLDTLACAYAAAGRYDDALRVEKTAIALAKEKEQHDLVAECEERIALFEAGKPYVDAL